jgi:cell division septation protein DedD
MKYDFTLDRKGMFSVLVSSVLMGALLFVAGLIVGSYWTANGPTVSAATAKKNASAGDLNAQPQQPVLLAEVPQTNFVLPNSSTTTVNPAALGAGNLTPPQAPPAAKPAGAEQPAAAGPEQGSEDKPANAPAADGSTPTAAKPEASSAPPTQNAGEANLLTVEVGTFLDANSANRLFKSLERKGYAPTFFTGRDAQSREWYAIRIGAYSDKQQAENAAANFTRQEKMKAQVRPLGSL